MQRNPTDPARDTETGPIDKRIAGGRLEDEGNDAPPEGLAEGLAAGDADRAGSLVRPGRKARVRPASPVTTE